MFLSPFRPSSKYLRKDTEKIQQGGIRLMHGYEIILKIIEGLTMCRELPPLNEV